MVDPLTILVDELENLEKLRADAVKMIEEQQSRIEILNHEIGTLSRLRQRMEKVCPPTEENGLASPTDAIVGLLRKHPDGLRTGQIADEIEHRIATNSKNKRRLIYSLTDQLKKRGVIARDENGVNRFVK
jgi:hypothetical protein